VPLQSFLNKSGVEKIDVTAMPDESIRIELTLTQDVEARVFKLKKFLDKPNRIVIDLQFPEVEEKESLSRQEVKKLQKARIIVVDAGHGGEDPGAIGKMGTREKDVVLKIAKKLHENLNKREGYRAFLTRTGDYYVPFKKRLKIGACPGHVVAYDMRGLQKKFALDCERFLDGVLAQAVTHNGDATLRRHMLNCKRHALSTGQISVRKESRDSSRKIDAAVTAIMAFGQRQEFLLSKRGQRTGKATIIQ
jgi:hypothetical protein